MRRFGSSCHLHIHRDSTDRISPILPIAMALQTAIEKSVGTNIVNVEPSIVVCGAPQNTFADWPIKPIDSTTTTHFTVAFSRASPVKGLVLPNAIDRLLTALQHGKITEAGPVLGLQADMRYNDHQAALVDNGDGTHTVYKMLHLAGRTNRLHLQSAMRADLFV